jgi:hypothetical protein
MDIDEDMETWTRTWQHGREHGNMFEDMETWTRSLETWTRHGDMECYSSVTAGGLKCVCHCCGCECVRSSPMYVVWAACSVYLKRERVPERNYFGVSRWYLPRNVAMLRRRETRRNSPVIWIHPPPHSPPPHPPPPPNGIRETGLEVGGNLRPIIGP